MNKQTVRIIIFVIDIELQCTCTYNFEGLNFCIIMRLNRP